MKPYMWMERAAPVVVVRSVPVDHIYGRVIWWSGLFVQRYDGLVFSVFDNGMLIHTTYDPFEALRFRQIRQRVAAHYQD